MNKQKIQWWCSRKGLFDGRQLLSNIDLVMLGVSYSFHCLGHPHPFFFRLASNAFPDFGSVSRIKKKNKKNHKKSRNWRPWYPRMTLKVNIYIFGLTKCTIYCKKCSCFGPVFLYVVTMLIFQIKRIISSEKLFNQVVTSFFGNAKNLGQSDNAKQRKKRG